MHLLTLLRHYNTVCASPDVGTILLVDCVSLDNEMILQVVCVFLDTLTKMEQCGHMLLKLV